MPKMLRLEIGKKYRFTLDTEKEMELVVRGTKAAPKGLELLDIEVDGLRGTYFDVNAALGHLPS